MIECEHCGKQTNKYEGVKFAKEYLDAYLSDYFNRPISDLRSSGLHVGEDRIFRDICTYVFREFGRMTIESIEKNYGIKHGSIFDIITKIDKSHHDFIFIEKDLGGKLPEALIG